VVDGIVGAVKNLRFGATVLLSQANPNNQIAAGQNWGVYDWCNQFLQSAEELHEATALLLSERAAENVVHCEVDAPTPRTPFKVSPKHSMQE
jgi:hypothetical protein